MKNNWRRVDNIITYFGKGVTPRYVENSSIIVLNQKCIRKNKIDYSFAQFIDDTKQYNEDKLLKLGDILVNSTGQGTAGRIAIIDYIPEGKKLITDSHILTLRTNNYFESKCLNYSLYSIENILQTYIDGSTGQGEFDKVRLFNVLLNYTKNRQEQKKITAVLSSLDHKIELNNRINAELEAMAKLIYDYWFVQFDFPISKEQALAMGNPKLEGKPYKTSGGKMVWNEALKREIPEGWEVKKLGKVLKTHLGGTPSTKKENYWNGEIPWMNSGEVANFPLISTEKSITQEAIINSSTKLLKKGSVLLSITRHLRVNILGIDACINQSIAGIEENEKFKNSYIYFSILNDIDRLMDLRTGAQQPHINKAIVDNCPFIVPNESILNLYYQTATPIIDRIINNAKQNQELASLRDWLLPMLMNGQVTVADAESKGKEVLEKEHTAKPKNDSYAKIQLLYMTIWANKEIEVKQGEMATAKDVYLLDRIYGVETGFQFKQHNWGSFDPEEKKLLNTKQYFHKVNFPNSKAVYVDLKDDGKLLDKIPNHLKETVFNAISEMNATVFSRYFGTQKAEKKELFATVLKCIEDRQSLELSMIRDEMAHWKIKQGGKESTKADKFTEAETREALEMILKENWHRNVMR
jgi:type I restriction enzyme S subunit